MNIKKVLLIGLTPLLFIMDMYLLNQITSLISMTSDAAIFVAAILIFVAVIINYFVIKFFIKIFKR